MLEWFLLSRLSNELSTYQGSPNHRLITLNPILTFTYNKRKIV